MLGKKGKKSRLSNEINAGSMADIAFLLLIFFLVTTTIAEDRGILVKLPPWSPDPPETAKLNKKDLYSILVNANDELLVRDEPMEIEDLRENVKNFISNPMKKADFPDTPEDAIVSLTNDRGTHYETYLEVYNEIQAAYNELRDEKSDARFGKPYDLLEFEQKKEINKIIPMKLSEAEPTKFGDEETE